MSGQEIAPTGPREGSESAPATPEATRLNFALQILEDRTIASEQERATKFQEELGKIDDLTKNELDVLSKAVKTSETAEIVRGMIELKLTPAEREAILTIMDQRLEIAILRAQNAAPPKQPPAPKAPTTKPPANPQKPSSTPSNQKGTSKKPLLHERGFNKMADWILKKAEKGEGYTGMFAIWMKESFLDGSESLQGGLYDKAMNLKDYFLSGATTTLAGFLPKFMQSKKGGVLERLENNALARIGERTAKETVIRTVRAHKPATTAQKFDFGKVYGHYSGLALQKLGRKDRVILPDVRDEMVFLIEDEAGKAAEEVKDQDPPILKHEQMIAAAEIEKQKEEKRRTDLVNNALSNIAADNVTRVEFGEEKFENGVLTLPESSLDTEGNVIASAERTRYLVDAVKTLKDVSSISLESAAGDLAIDTKTKAVTLPMGKALDSVASLYEAAKGKNGISSILTKNKDKLRSTTPTVMLAEEGDNFQLEWHPDVVSLAQATEALSTIDATGGTPGKTKWEQKGTVWEKIPA